MSESDYCLMIEGWQLKDQREWAKFRLVCQYSISGHLKKTMPLQKIIELPLIDGRVNDKVQANIDYLLGLKKEAQEKRKAKGTPAAV